MVTDRQKWADDWLNRNYIEWKEVEALKLRLELSESMLSNGVSRLSRPDVQQDHVGNTQEIKQVESSYLREVVENRMRSLDTGDAQTIEVIGRIPDAELRMILLRRYIYRWSWRQVAHELAYDRKTVYIKKNKALDMVASYLSAKM